MAEDVLQHLAHAHLFPPSQPLLYSTYPISRTWQNMVEYGRRHTLTPCTRPPISTVLTSTIFHLPGWQNMAEYGRTGRIWQETRRVANQSTQLN